MTNVVFHPNSTSVYLVYMGDTKYPKEPAAVTIPIAIVIELKGKILCKWEIQNIQKNQQQ